MLINTFCHLPGVGAKTERALWREGVLSWEDFAVSPAETLPARARGPRLKEVVECSARSLAGGDPVYFAERLPAGELWRMYPDFSSSACFLDIETDGLSAEGGIITAATVYDGEELRAYVYGENMDDLFDDLSRHSVIITYNGRCFDVPFVETFFGEKVEAAQIDLRFVMSSLGFKGGLKGCERALGMDRGELDGVDGFFAVLLWDEYVQTGDRAVLDTLLAYNALDTVNLERLMVEAYNLKLEKTPFADYRRLSPAPAPPAPFAPDPEVVSRIMARFNALRGTGA